MRAGDILKTTYQITDQTKTVDGVTLHRIMALPGNRFAAHGVLGGWIEKEENLSDGAWVSDNACVFGDAVVSGNTLIEDDAQIYGSAKIHGDAGEPLIISWDLKVHGGNWTETPYYGSGAIWTINISSPDTVRIGCRDYTFEKWHRSFKAIMRVYRMEAIDEKGIRECTEIYNRICHIYGKQKYAVDLNEVLEAYQQIRTQTALNVIQALIGS